MYVKFGREGVQGGKDVGPDLWSSALRGGSSGWCWVSVGAGRGGVGPWTGYRVGGMSVLGSPSPLAVHGLFWRPGRVGVVVRHGLAPVPVS